MIHADDIARVRAEADTVAIIGGYVKLRRSGISHRGPCPFHHGKHDNLAVRGGYWRCWVCGEKGDTFDFLQKHLGLDFIAAVRMVAETMGITLRETDDSTRNDPRIPLWEAIEAAREVFEAELRSDIGEAARAYLASRGLTLEDARRFELGWAPYSDRMRVRLVAMGFDDARLLTAGLLVDRGEEGHPEIRTRFWGRITFPVRDMGGRLAGFGARRIDDGEPTYLNSPDSPTFNKSELLYNLHNAKQSIRKAGRILIVEGYMDAIRLVLAGVGEVVAPMGTSMTPQQAKLIRRFSPIAYLLYDRDVAGLKATFRNADALLAAGVTVRVVTLPEGHDPDSFMQAYGPASLEEELMAAVDVFERKIELLQVGGYFDDVGRKHDAFDRLVPTIQAAADPLTKGLYTARAAEALGVGEETVRHAVAVAGRRR